MTAATNQTPIDCHHTVWFHNACGPSTDTTYPASASAAIVPIRCNGLLP